MNEPCAVCGEPAVHMHHRKMRSQGGDNSPANLIPVCLADHTAIHANPKDSYENGLLVKSWGTVRPLSVGMQQTFDGDEVPHEQVVVQRYARLDKHDGLEPGTKCETCKRRVPFPRKKTSPQSKVVSYRVPLDDADVHNEIAEAAAKELGLHENPHWRWALNTECYAMVLQGARLTEKGA